MPDSVKWSGKRSSRNQRQSYLLIGSFSRISSWNCTRKKWTWFACQSLRCETVFDCRKFSFFCYDARHIQGFSIFAPLTDLNVVLPAGTLQTIPLKDLKVKHLSVNSLILICKIRKSQYISHLSWVLHTKILPFRNWVSFICL